MYKQLNSQKVYHYMFDIEIKLIFNFLIFLLFIVIIKLAIYYGINHKTHINEISSRVYFIMAQRKYILNRCRSLYSEKKWENLVNYWYRARTT